MALNKYFLGDLIEQITETNEKGVYGPDDVVGITIEKTIIPTKADVSKTDLSGFIVIKPNDFIYNPRTHGKKIGMGYNSSKNTYIISWNNIGFRIKSDKRTIVLPDYLFMYIGRLQWDRFACFNSWGSSTEVFAWKTFCEMEIELPSITIQQKYVDIYKSMVENQKVYESRLEDLKLVCDGYIEDLRKKMPCEKIGKYLIFTNEKNEKNIKNVKSVSVEKIFKEVSSKVNKNELKSYKIVHPNEITYVQTTNNEKVFAFAINDTMEDIVVTSVNNTFKTNSGLDPFYLSMWFKRLEFDRFARFHSWGSARETIEWETICNVAIPIPDITVQKSIAEIFKVLEERKEINEKLKNQIKDICPVLIQGALKEGREEKTK